jgi:hypothetical protein
MEFITEVTEDLNLLYNKEVDTKQVDLRETKKPNKGQVIKKITPLALFLCIALM